MRTFAKENENRMNKFVLNDEARKNSHGFYLLNAGGKFERFRENPVMLHNHNSDMLTGKWNDLEIQNSLLLASPEFDESDPDAKKLKGKVERGYLKGASPGIIILQAEWRNNLATNESEIYVTEWELYEVSTVAVPSNAGALQLKVYDNNCRLVNDDKIGSHIERIISLSAANGKSNPIINSNNKMSEVKLTAEALVALGIQENAGSAAISAAVVALKAKEAQSTAELAAEKKKAAEALKAQADEMVDLAVKAGRIPADKKDNFVKLALADFETAKATLEAIPVKQSLGAQVQTVLGSETVPAERKAWTLLEWMKQDMAGLKKLQAEQPEVYLEIVNRKK
jgi:HK97 family phage prohead protease